MSFSQSSDSNGDVQAVPLGSQAVPEDTQVVPLGSHAVQLLTDMLHILETYQILNMNTSALQ